MLLASDSAIQTLNRDYRGIDAPTDVLAFSQMEGDPMPLAWAELTPPLLGDLVISVDTARRQAAEFGWSLQDEVEALLVHGLLHLLGYDHHNPEEARAMREREAAVLGERNLGTRAEGGSGAL